jgi:hypothetical protein
VAQYSGRKPTFNMHRSPEAACTFGMFFDFFSSLKYSSSKQVLGHKACYNLTEEVSHHLFTGRPKGLFTTRNLQPDAILFADDLAITASSEDGLQHGFSNFSAGIPLYAI